MAGQLGSDLRQEHGKEVEHGADVEAAGPRDDDGRDERQIWRFLRGQDAKQRRDGIVSKLVGCEDAR